MGKYWKLLGEYTAVTTAYSAFAGAGLTSPYTPERNGRLIGLRVEEGSAALTSVTTGIQIKLTHAAFVPNSIEVGYVGAGIHTAPRTSPQGIDWVIDQEVKAGVPIVLEGRVLGAYTNVTNEIFLWGLFEG